MRIFVKSQLHLEENKTESNKEEIEDIQAEFEQLRKEQSSLTKNAVVNRLSKALAKARKHGIVLFKWMLTEGEKSYLKHSSKRAAAK